MVKYKIIARFRDIHTGEIYSVNQEVDFTAKRAKEAEANLKEHGKVFFERIEAKKAEKVDEVNGESKE